MNAIADTIAGLIAATLSVLGLGQPAPTDWNGYLEADYVYVAPLSPGRITAIAVDEGDTVSAGQALVTLDSDAQIAALTAAKAGVAQAAANLDNLETGSRTAEIAVIQASLKQAQAQRDLAKLTADRAQALADKGQATLATLQQNLGALAAAEAQVEQLQAQLQVAQLPAREAQRLAAEAALAMAQSQANSAQIALDDRALASPITGRVDHRFYDPGEVAGAGAPLLSLYDPAALKVIFFVPEARRATLTPGEVLAVTCDGCPPGLQARVTRIGVEPQFTPPILYSRDERGRLVFRAEARLAQSLGLSPGQPVSLAPGAP